MSSSHTEYKDYGEFVGRSSAQRHFKYTYVAYIARGAFGVTHKVKRTADGAIFALKITKNSLTSLSSSDDELKLLELASRHFGVTKLVDAAVFTETPHRAQLQVMEFCDAGDLNHAIRIQARMGNAFSEEAIKSILVQIFLTLHHLHDRLHMLHRDIKASNVLLCHSGLAKLGDFGLSKAGSHAKTFCGTLSHMAPELVLANESVYDTKADIWSLGIVLHHLITLETPFGEREAAQMDMERARKRFQDAANGIHPITDFSKAKATYSADLLALCERMLRLDPTERPTSLEILGSPYLEPEVRRFPGLIMSSTHLSDDVKRSILFNLVDDGFCDVTQLPPEIQEALNHPPEPTSSLELTIEIDAQQISTTTPPLSPTAAGALLSPHTPHTPGSAVIVSSLAWKMSQGRWKVRCMVLSPVHVILVDIDAETARRIAEDPMTMAETAIMSSQSTKLKVAALRECLAQEPIPGPSPAGESTPDAPDVLYPLRFVRADDKEWVICVATSELQTLWTIELQRARIRETRKRDAAATTSAYRNDADAVA